MLYHKHAVHMLVVYQQVVGIIPDSEYSLIKIANAKLWYPSKNWLSLVQLLCEAGHSSLVPQCQQPTLECFIRMRLFRAMVLST